MIEKNFWLNNENGCLIMDTDSVVGVGKADTQEEFDDWYENIKKLSLYETGVTASFGDEFITLSCCSYHVEDGRFVVVARRKTSKKPL